MTRDEVAAHFEQHGPMVFRRALMLLGNVAEAQDVLQEVFIRAMKAADRFERRAEVSTWLYQITTNYCLNQIRNAKRRRELLDERTDALPGQLDPADRLALRQLMERADPKEAEVAAYVYFDGMTRKEVAEIVGVSERTVKARLAAFNAFAKKRLSRA